MLCNTQVTNNVNFISRLNLYFIQHRKHKYDSGKFGATILLSIYVFLIENLRPIVIYQF